MPSPMDAALHNARKRRRGFRTGTSELFGTHTFAPGTTGIDTGESFGSDAERAEPITFGFRLAVGAGGSATVLRLGSASRRTLVSVTGGVSLVVVAGGSGDDQAVLIVNPAFPAEDVPYDFVLAVEPALGRVSVWRDGVLVGSAASANGDFDGAWADDDDTGLVGDSLSDVEMTPLSVFQKQRPQRRRP